MVPGRGVGVGWGYGPLSMLRLTRMGQDRRSLPGMMSMSRTAGKDGTKNDQATEHPATREQTGIPGTLSRTLGEIPGLLGGSKKNNGDRVGTEWSTTKKGISRQSENPF